ncbi:MAG: protein phosphatase 2C domain-containing protein [Proteobacteria bacterium]|nr:protein phosphatase 2C domain-containing protein [Pseudomonadota bacterium]
MNRDQSADTPSISIAGLSDKGKVRQHNEDSFLTVDLKRELVVGPSSLALRDGDCLIDHVQGKFIAVADGVAGAGGGALASAVVVNSLARHIVTVMPWIVEAGQNDVQLSAAEFERAFKRCQKRLRSEAARHGYKDRPIATTLTVGYIAWPQLYIAHAGDSRCYLYRAGYLRRLTSDDTMAQQLIDHQLVSPDRVAEIPFANVLVNAIGGSKDDLSVEFRRIPLMRGDRLLLCTDGLTHHVSDDEIAQTMQAAVSSEMCSRRLVDLANARGGKDNITAVVASIESHRTLAMQATGSAAAAR